MTATPKRARIELAPLTQWITEAALRHGAGLPAYLMQRLGIGHRRAVGLLQRLQAMQWLDVDGPPRARRWRPGALRQVVRRYALLDLQEDRPWHEDFAPCFALAADVRVVAQHAFTELLNNAIDHSGGRMVTVSMRQTPLHLQLLVSDDGCGLFERIAQGHGLGDPTLAMFELSKGKLTTAPHCHRGHGLFFTSRLADVFDLHANGSAFQYRGGSAPSWQATRPGPHKGTSVYFAYALDSQRSLDAVLRAHSADGAGHGFERTRLPLQLLAKGAALISRAEARRVAARLADFRQVELDFAGVDMVGHGFADELMRVLNPQHANVRLEPFGTTTTVASMLASAAGG